MRRGNAAGLLVIVVVMVMPPRPVSVDVEQQQQQQLQQVDHRGARESVALEAAIEACLAGVLFVCR